MANHPSAQKRIRQTEARKTHNKYYAKSARNALKKLRNTKNKKEAAELILEQSSVFGKITEKGLEEFSLKFDLDLDDLNIDLPDINLDLIEFIAGEGEREVDENIETENECPKCGYRF